MYPFLVDINLEVLFIIVATRGPNQLGAPLSYALYKQIEKTDRLGREIIKGEMIWPRSQQVNGKARARTQAFSSVPYPLGETLPQSNGETSLVQAELKQVFSNQNFLKR